MSPRTMKSHRMPRPRAVPIEGSVTAASEPSSRTGSATAATIRRAVAASSSTPFTRTIVLWSPDWPITALLRSTTLTPDAKVAVTSKGMIFACSASARADGVRRGLRIREAQARCPELEVREHEPAIDARAFEPVLAAIEALTPGVQVLRPGMVAIRARGPARYYGSEKAAAMALAGVLDDLGIHGTSIGIADGPFAAELAARQQAIVPAGRSVEFLAPHPITVIGDAELVALLRRLGIRTLGEFAALSETDVRDRFGEPAAWLHALASGSDTRPVAARTAPAELDVTIDFEPPLDRIDQVTFGVRASADRFIAQLVAARLVCTALRVEVDTELGDLSERTWLHPRSFSPADVVDRVRWQLQGSGEIDVGLRSPITRVRLVPEAVDAIGNHEIGLWGAGPDERVHHALTRVQSMLGHGAVLQPVVGGGRSLGDRQNLVPWGDPTDEAPGLAQRPPARPWPGRLPDPAPSTVFSSRHPVSVFASDGSVVGVDDRGFVTRPPAQFASGSTVRGVRGWAGPWPVDERWWDASTARSAHRFQLVDDAGSAWLLVLEGQDWFLEGKYD
jgi:protein ImuB